MVAQMVKNLPAMQETQVLSLGQEGPLEKGMTTHSSILAWRMPRTEQPGGLQSSSVQFSSLSRVQLFATPWTVALQAPLSMGFFRQEYWSELPCPPPGDFHDPGIEPTSLTSPALVGGSCTTSTTREAITWS